MIFLIQIMRKKSSFCIKVNDFCFTDIPMPDVYQADKEKKCVYIRKQNSMKYLIY